MKKEPKTMIHEQLDMREKLVIALCVFLIVPALLINLGLLAVIEDEAIRGLVSLEMWYSGDYIAPTINAQAYYNKPPLYNWIILLSYTLWGQATEFSLRFPTALFTLIYGGLIYHLYKNEMGKLAAVSIALLTITCGRIFFYDSFKGLIDMCFSMCMFSLMIGSYRLARQERWTAMFVFAYLMTAIGFLLKTLPAIVFLGLSLLVILIAEKSFKQFFKLGHFIGIALFGGIVGSYYLVYSADHDIVALFTRMITESSDRTVVKFGISKTIKHLFSFPFEVFFHFLPWTILSIYLFQKGALNRIWANPFLRMNVLLLGVNILLYWTSPQVYARYLLMFPPLIFAPLYYLHQHNQAENTVHFKIVKWILYTLVMVIAFGFVSTFWVERIRFIPFLYYKGTALCIMGAVSIYLMYTARKFRLLYIFLVVIIFRIGFDWLVLPDRNANDYSDEIRVSSIEAGQKYGSKGIYCTENGLNRTVSYYITRETQQLLPSIEGTPPNGVLITSEPKENCKKIGNIKSRTPSNDYLVLECNERPNE